MRRLGSHLATAAIIFLMFPSAALAGSFYVDVVGATQGNIDGDVTGPGPVIDQIEAFELHHFVSRSRSPGALPAHETILFTKKRLDPSTLKLIAAWDQGELLTVTFAFCADPSCDPLHYVINLTGARVISIEPWTRPSDQRERIGLVYQTIEFVFPGESNESVTLVP